MNKIITKPHYFFFGLIPLFIIIGLIQSDKTMDINLGDVYFAFAMHHWYYLSAIFFGLIGLNYFSLYWAKKTPKKWLTLLHIFLQIIALLLFIIWNDLHSSLSSNTIIFISFIIFIFSVFIHLVNFFVSLFLKTE